MLKKIDGYHGRRRKKSLALYILDEAGFQAFKKNAKVRWQNWLKTTGFKAEGLNYTFLPSGNGEAEAVVAAGPDLEELGAMLRRCLPNGGYHFAKGCSADLSTFIYGWGLGGYRFDRYREVLLGKASLELPAEFNERLNLAQLKGVFVCRDLINTPPNDMLPSHLQTATAEIAQVYGARLETIVGEELIEKDFPAIHAVGKASSDAPRLLDMRWGDTGPSIVLVGKGVCFDSGGLDLKSAAGMKLMKKDMGGAAHVLAVATMVMDMGLPVRLRVLIPAVENAVSGNAFRPSDVLNTRKGLTVEVGNTDAEGRLVLADALTEAGSPDLIVDFATLTGAARVALGTGLPGVFASDDEIGARLVELGQTLSDPVWRLPLHTPYRGNLKSSVADINNISDAPYGGAITAALFLKEFVEPSVPWVHIDVMAWNSSDKAAHPTGGEAMGARAVYGLVESMIVTEQAL
ncbi:MAG: leucyl aminopeptidase family protein [Myxococcota bacterium]|nr:leucyl aminopeptidase family protein [Myxococcota bacterium]